MDQPAIAPPRLRPITGADEDFLLEVYASARSDVALLERLPADERLAFLQRQSQLQQAALGVRYGSADYSVIMVGDERVGRLYLQRTASLLRVLDIALLPKWRGRGLGTLLLKAVLAEATEARVPVALEVHTDNRAQRLYERLGFGLVGRTGQHDALMWGAPGGAADERVATTSRGASEALQELSAAQFVPHVGTLFTVAASQAGSIPLLLQEVEELSARHSSPFRTAPGFSLVFCGPSDPLMTQGAFDLTHPVIGTLSLFLVPVRADASAAYYQATIN